MIKRQSYTVEEAHEKLKRYCAYQERCHQDVKKKLKSMNMIDEAIDHIIVRLIEEDYLNEARFARTFVRGKFRIKKWGRYRLVSELQKRGLSKFTIKDAISEIKELEYIETFDALAEKRLASLKETNPLKKKRKLADYLLYRGWETHLVYAKVKELIP
ncbi:MAG: RecX family transcriptional regulator [Bacteroidia bacterium]|nr:RecX family transcriptional regulator [Bacteroidia bacterium]NNF81391.1 RecX family transcriptional regulator [Flavobacteriaceae bacterium]NNK69554.1 RecX family transcriptional regulator [Flavobacteriaceae bacterium]NNL80070.1 RecX family transcriptional regulator [Flavobacteriaceae bacterium]